VSYSLKINETANLINVTYDESTSFDDRKSVLQELVEILSKNTSINVVVDVRKSKHTLTMDQEIEYGDLLASQSKYFSNNKTAIVTGKANPHPLIQTEAYISGFEKMVEFQDMPTALAWLAGDLK